MASMEFYEVLSRLLMLVQDHGPLRWMVAHWLLYYQKEEVEEYHQEVSVLPEDHHQEVSVLGEDLQEEVGVHRQEVLVLQEVVVEGFVQLELVEWVVVEAHHEMKDRYFSEVEKEVVLLHLYLQELEVLGEGKEEEGVKL